MTDATYAKIKKINPDFGDANTRLGKSFLYTNNLAMERSGKPSGKGVDDKGAVLTHPVYNSDEHGLKLAQFLHEEMKKSKKDPLYRPQLNEAAQFAKKSRGQMSAPDKQESGESDADFQKRQKDKANRSKGPFDVEKVNKFLTERGAETIPVEKDNSPEGPTTLGDVVSNIPGVGQIRNLANKIAPSMVTPTKTQTAFPRIFDNFDSGDSNPELYNVNGTNEWYNTNPEYIEEAPRPKDGKGSLKFPMEGRELKKGVDPKSLGMAKPPIGNGAAMPGSEPGISKNQFAKNDDDEMKKKMNGFKFNSLMT